METVKTIEQLKTVLKEKIATVEESYEINGIWKVSTDTDDFTVSAGDTMEIIIDIDENEEYLCDIDIELARTLSKNKVLRFGDMGWDDNDTYIYWLDDKKLFATE